MNQKPQHPEVHDRSRRFGIIIVVLLALLVAAGFAVRPLWQLRKQTLAERFAIQAREARLRHDWKGAHAALQAAHGLAPSHPEVLRGLAEFYSVFNNPEAVAYWEMLEGMGALSQADRLAYTRLALKMHRPDIARRVLRPFYEEHPANPEGLLLVSEIFAEEGDLPRARVAAEDAAAMGEDAQAVELRLAMLEFNSSQPADWARAKVRLMTLTTTGSRLRGEAALELLVRGVVTAGDESLLTRFVQDGPEAAFAERLARLVLRIRANPVSTSALVQEFAATNQLDAPSPQLAFAAEQFARLRLDRAVLELIPEKLALSHTALCRLRLGALAATDNVAGVEQLLAEPDVPLLPMHVAIFRAGAAQAAGRTNELKVRWQAAISACRDNANAMELLAQNAEAVGATDVATQAWEFILHDPVSALRAAKELIRLGTALRDPRTIYVALRRMVQLRPDDSESRLGLAYCQLLLQLDDEAAKLAVAAGPNAYRNRNLYQIVAALSALRQDDVEKATQAIEDPAINWTGAPVSWRVVRTATFGRAGLASRAREVAAGLNPNELSAPELALVGPWLPKKPSRETNP